MFGLKTVREKDLDAQKARIEALEAEVKGYYENQKAVNQYFEAIAPLLKGLELDNVLAEIKRSDLKHAYETNAPAWGIINKISKAVGEMFTFLELQRWNGKEWKDVDKHWLTDLLHHPNDRFNCKRFGEA